MIAGSDDTSRAIERMGLLATGLLCWWAGTTAFEGGNPAQYPLVHVLVLACFGWGFLLLGSAASKVRVPRSAALVGVGAGLIFLAHGAVNAEVARFVGTPATTDVRVYMDYAAWLVLQGENPYTHDLTAAYPAHRATLQYSTPLVDGTLTGRLAYPAGAFLVHLPTVLLGISDRWVYLGFFMATMMVLLWRSGPTWRPVVLLPFLLEPRYIGYAFSGVSDGVWAFWLVCLVAWWHNPRARALFLGLACATKQHAWILAPFLAIRTWRETDGDSRAKAMAVARLAGGSLLVFGLVNAPFVLWGPSAWWLGVFEPMSAPMITWGTGLSSIAAWGRVDLPRGFWSFSQYGVWALALVTYARHASRLGAAVWLLPALVLFCGHRSLTSYWYYAVFPLVMELASSQALPVIPSLGASARRTIMGWAVFGVGLALVIMSWSVQSTGLTVQVGRPLWVEGHRVNQMLVGLTNDTSEMIRPRFQVQTGPEQPLFWDRRSGPEALEPGESATYIIGTRVPFEAFEMARGAVLQVSSSGSYYPRTSVRIAPDTSFPRPDRVPNPAFQFWADGGSRPQFWQVRAEGPATVSWLRQRGLELRLEGAAAALSVHTTIMEPRGPVRAVVELPDYANQLPELGEIYGLSLSNGESSGLVLFGDRQGSGVLPDGRSWMMVEAPRGRASEHVLDLPALMDSLGLRDAPDRVRLPRFAHLDFPLRPVTLGVVFETHGLSGGRQAAFHGFWNSEDRNPHQRYADEVDSRAHRRWLAEIALQAGEPERARDWLGKDGGTMASLYLALAEDALRTGSTLEVFSLLEASEPHLGTEDEVLVALELYERMGALADGESYLEELTMYSLQSAGPEVAGPLWAALLQHFEQRDCSRYEDIRVWGEPRGLAPYLGEAGLGPCSQD